MQVAYRATQIGWHNIKINNYQQHATIKVIAPTWTEGSTGETNKKWLKQPKLHSIKCQFNHVPRETPNSSWYVFFNSPNFKHKCSSFHSPTPDTGATTNLQNIKTVSQVKAEKHDTHYRWKSWRGGAETLSPLSQEQVESICTLPL